MGAYDIKIRRRAWLPGLLWGLLWMGQAAAEEAVEEPRWFQVELIIFAHKSDDAMDSERWPEIAGVTLPENLRQLSLPFTPAPAAAPVPAVAPLPAAAATPAPEPAAVQMPEPFQILGEADMQLNDMAARIARSKRFEPLLHVAWRQPTLADEQTQPILIYDGMTAPYSDEEIAALQAQIAAAQEAPVPALAEAAPTSAEPLAAGTIAADENGAEAGPPVHRLVGTVRVSVARYLHLNTDLIYRIPVMQKAAVPVPDLDLWYDRPYPTLRDPQGPAYVLAAWPAVRGFRLQESRRMRSKEIHYLDNPFFGVVALVTPYELPVAETPKAPEPQKPANAK